MTTPPGGDSSTLAAIHALLRQQAAMLQAALHQQQTYTNIPSSAAQYQQARQNAPQNPVPGQQGAVPTVGWLQQAMQTILAQQASQSHRGGAPQPVPTPPATPRGGTTGMPANFNGAVPWAGPGGIPGQWTPIPGTQPAAVPGMMMPGMPAVSPQQSGGNGGHNQSSGMGNWARANLPRVGYALGGPVGAAVGAAVAYGPAIPGEIRSQRDKNAYYQSIEGGSNLAGFGERAHEEAYRWSTFGVLSSDESRRAFKGVTQLGYNSKVEGGPGRQDALNFVYHGKTAYGATVDESLQELQVASKSALTNFKDLSTALKDVSDSAGKAGVNAQMARAQMTQLLDQAQSSGYGSSATGVAQLEQKTLNSYGRAYQGVDASGRLSMSHAYMAASVAGISLSKYLTGGASVKGAADQKLDNATISAVLKPEARAWVIEQLNQSGGDPSPEVIAQIAEELLNRFYAEDAGALASAVASLSGYTAYAQDPVKAAGWVVEQLNGKGVGVTAKDMQKTATKQQKATSKTNSVQKNVGDNLRDPVGGDGTNSGVSALGGTLDTESSGGFLGFGSHESKAVQAYNNWHNKNGGQEDPVLYSLLNAIHGDDKAKVEVSTKDGKKVVTLADAIKNHPNELASGKAVVVEGDQAGKAVSDILGKDKVDPLRDFSKEAAKTDSSGQSYSDWKAANTSSTGKLQISLTAEARRLLTVMDNTGLAGSAGSGTPPTNTNADNASRG